MAVHQAVGVENPAEARDDFTQGIQEQVAVGISAKIASRALPRAVTWSIAPNRRIVQYVTTFPCDTAYHVS